MQNSEHKLEMKNITKLFPGVRALSNVDFKVKKGDIHALVGENGAGKSTLIKVISGVHKYGSYEGEMFVDGSLAKYTNIKSAEKKGVVCIHQELHIFPDLSVSENIFLTNKPSTMGIVNFDQMYVDTMELLKKIGMNTGDQININPDEKLMNLGIGQRQLVEIAKALAKEVSLLILDEPTAALTESEVEILLDIVLKLKEKGVTCIYISHRLDEVMRIADKITILRDGETIDTCEKTAIDKNKMISLMVGRELKNLFPREQHERKDVGFEIQNYSVPHPDIPGKKLINNVNLKAHKGEILGISGLMGAGRTELFASIFGAFREKGEGEVYIEGEKVRINNPQDALKKGFVILSEDRKKYGLNMLMTIKENTTLAGLKKVSRYGVLNENKEATITQGYVESTKIAAANIDVPVSTLSGGNQQKVVLAKALFCDPKIIIMDEPTRGIDVGAKYEIYKLMNELVNKGVIVIMISSEMEEILGMSDRILTMAEGRITGEFDIMDVDQESLLEASVAGG